MLNGVAMTMYTKTYRILISAEAFDNQSLPPWTNGNEGSVLDFALVQELSQRCRSDSGLQRPLDFRDP
jgi:hypothetical protein